MTISELASDMGIDISNLNKSLKRNPTLSTLEGVAKALNISIAELFSKPEEDVEGYVSIGGNVFSIRRNYNVLSIPQIDDYNVLSEKIKGYITEVLSGKNQLPLMYLYQNRCLFCLSYNADCFALTVQSTKGLEFIVRDKIEYDNQDGSYDIEQLKLYLVEYIAEPARY